MKRNLFVTAVMLWVAVGFLSAQELLDEGSYGIDYGKKLIVVSGQLPEGIKSFKKTIEFEGEPFTYYRSEMPLAWHNYCG